LPDTSVLISGAGIAGPTLAYWLRASGFAPTIVERSPRLRTGGYIIDFWGVGFDVAERMGLGPALRREGYAMRRLDVVNRRGRRIARVPVDSLTAGLGAGFTSLPRGALAAHIFGSIAPGLDVMFGDQITHLVEGRDGVAVTFERHAPRTFDLVIGADGLHSRVRELIFGPQARFERYLGLKVAAFECAGYRPRDELTYVMYSQPGRYVARFAMRDDRTLILMIFSDTDPRVPSEPDAQRTMLRARFAGTGWECLRMLDAMDAESGIYVDRVSQIDMPAAGASWTKGRVALIGDAAFCISLLGGQGSSLAMAAAYVLAGELHRAGGGYVTAFARYQALLETFIAGKQRTARRFAGVLVPRTAAGVRLRDQACRLLAFRPLARLLGVRGFSDSLRLPAY